MSLLFSDIFKVKEVKFVIRVKIALKRKQFIKNTKLLFVAVMFDCLFAT